MRDELTMELNIEEMALLFKALQFAAQKHQHQRRKNEAAVPYINHLIAVADILWEIGHVYEMPTIIAGILHDTLEDTETTPAELEAAFGAVICGIVQEVTDDKRLPKPERKRLQIEHAQTSSRPARHVKLADKICNVQDIASAPPAGWSWQRRVEYVDWAENVVRGLRGVNPPLERHFDLICAHARQILGVRPEHGA